ncbi:MAG: S9 family peptidase [Bryobacteraceae bacterium]
MLRRSLALYALSAALALAAGKKPVTLESLSTAQRPRGPAGIVWAPDGKRFAYREGRSIRLYDAPTGQKKELISLEALGQKAVKPVAPERFAWENRRVTEQEFQWAASGKELLILASGDLFLLHTDTGVADQLTATAERERDPKLSPDARRISFRSGHDLYVLDIASRKTTRLTHDGSATLLNGELDWVYPEELELGTAHWWSPDGRSVAYLQFDVSREPAFPQVDLLPRPARLEPERYPKPGTPNPDVRLGIVPAAGGATRWIDLGDTRDALLARVAWSPAGMLTAQRLNRIQNRLDLHLIDPASGSAKILLSERDPYWVNVNDALRFLKDGKRFVWGSERDGFLHLYLYGTDGKLERQITRGQWEVTEVAGVDEAAREVYYVSTEQSPLERHLYRIGLNGKDKRRLSVTAGTHAIRMSPTCDYYMDSASSLTAPARQALHTRDGAEVRVFQEAAPQQHEILPTEILTVKAAGGTPLYARLIKPAGFKAGVKYPAIVMVYGGPHAQSVRNAWSGATWDQALAQRGFVIWQLDNRGSAGRGHAFESKVFRNLGAQELEDQKTGVAHLVSLGFVDPARIGIYGWSYGGYMTLYSLANAPGLFRAGIAGAPVTDWRNYDSIYTERYMGLPAENPEGYTRSSPIGKAGDITARLMLVHNFEDDNVHFQNTMQMADALQRANKRFEMMIYPQKAHGVTGPARKHLLEATTEFFERSLKP